MATSGFRVRPDADGPRTIVAAITSQPLPLPSFYAVGLVVGSQTRQRTQVPIILVLCVLRQQSPLGQTLDSLFDPSVESTRNACPSMHTPLLS